MNLLQYDVTRTNRAIDENDCMKVSDGDDGESDVVVILLLTSWRSFSSISCDCGFGFRFGHVCGSLHSHDGPRHHS